jgi:hypothetical protein
VSPPYRSRAAALAVLAALGTATAVTSQTAQAPRAQETVRAIAAPARALPEEAASGGVTRFSFLAYGDTRGRRDGVDLQYEHSLIVDSMLATIRRRAATEFPVRFVLQSGDAVTNGRQPGHWNRSYVALINRLTVDGGMPYFQAPGNHDVTSAADLKAPGRLTGLRNYLDANRNLIPPDGHPRRLDGYPTFAFGYGNTFIIGIDTNIADDETQFQWVTKQLEGLDRRRYTNVITFHHHPPFSSGPHGGAIVEAPVAALRARYQPLFHQHRVRMTITGHEHLFEHWVERYGDGTGPRFRADHVVSGGGGAPIYAYRGEPDLRSYLKAFATDKTSLEHLVKPGPAPGDNPYHYVVVQVDGNGLQIEVIGVDWGRDFRPYRSNISVLRDSGGR